MPYKDYESQKRNALLNYYKNQEKRKKYQQEYDKTNKERKREYDRKRWEGRKDKNHLEHYSRRKYFAKLFLKYKGCQECGSLIRLNLHHKKYTKSIKDVMLLCEKCHKELHRKRFKPTTLY